MRHLLILAAVIFASACSSSGQRPTGPTCTTLVPTASFDAMFEDMLKGMRDQRRVENASTLESKTYVLALSGGGPWGAFGSGFLRGWTTNGNAQSRPPARPEKFDVVTGVSTGALMSTFAFLGSAYDDRLIAQYTNKSDADIFKARPTLSLLWANSLATTGPLVQSLFEMITPDVIEAVAREHEAGRKLLVGAVNLDTGAFETFDLTELASQFSNAPEQTRSCYVAALTASAAQPLAFPPTFINDAMYTDGGVRQTVFITNLHEALDQHVEQIKNRNGGDAPNFDISVIMNTDLRVDPQIKPGSKVNNRLPAILERTLPIVVDQTDQNGLELIQAASKLNPNIDMRWTSARGHKCSQFDDDPVNKEFKPKKMACLIRYGDEGIWEGTAWQ